jgi:hypothetical protein
MASIKNAGRDIGTIKTYFIKQFLLATVDSVCTEEIPS